MSRAEAGELALRALEQFAAGARIGDFRYAIREQEGAGWNGPRVQAWAVGAMLADQALELAGSAIPAPFPRPPIGAIPKYYIFPPAEVAK